jgi:hypothetical protein
MSEQTQGKSSFEMLIERPKFNFWWAIVFGILLSFATWWLTRQSVDLVYIPYPVDTVAKKEFNNLTVAWDGNPVPSLCVARIAIVNRGNTPLGQSHFPPVDPVRIMSNQKVEILSVDVVNASRPNLRMSGTISSNKDSILLSIKDGDALEAGDGATFRIVFSEECSKASFEVAGRVIGLPTGVRMERPYDSKAKSSVSLPWLLPLATLQVLMIVGYGCAAYDLLLPDRYKNGLRNSALYGLLGSNVAGLWSTVTSIQWHMRGTPWLP